MNLVFESDRLHFRPLEESDLDLMVEQWTDRDVAKYVGGKTYRKEELISEMPIVTRRCAGGCIGIWCLIDKATREKIGYVNLLPMPVDLDDTDWDLVTGDKIPDGDIEIGYVLKKTAWGKGFATEACRRLLSFAFEESPLERIVASIESENSASRNVLEKSGLIDIGLIQSYGKPSPGFRITKQEWIEKQ